MLSYFIGSGYAGEYARSKFTRMYGKDAEFINVASLSKLANTLNKKFLEAS